MKEYARNLLFVVLIAVMVFPIGGCAQTSPQLPIWINNPSEQFSENRFLMAVGSAPDRQGAKNQAQANLAKIFVSRVEVDESYIQEFKETMDSETGTTVQESSQLITQSEIGSNQQMKNVQIKELYESENGRFYALAAMDRMETSQLYTEEINKNKEFISSLRQKANQTNSKLDRLIYMKQVLPAARVNDMLINQRAILSGRTTQGEGATLSEITQEYREAKKECTARIQGEDIPREVQSTISRQLQNEGFTLAAAGEDPVVNINVNLMMEPADINRPNYEFVQWALQIEAQNLENGQWFSTYTADGREGASSESYARRRAIQGLRETISSEFPDFINNELLSVR